MKLSAEGRNVIITGGSQGLGLATAKCYVEAAQTSLFSRAACSHSKKLVPCSRGLAQLTR